MTANRFAIFVVDVAAQSGGAREFEHQLGHALARRQGEDCTRASNPLLAIFRVHEAIARNDQSIRARHHLLDTEMASLVGNVVGRVRGRGAIFQGDNGFLQWLAGVETHDGTRYGGKRQPAIWSCGRRCSCLA